MLNTIFLLDNFDSFTYNLVDQFRSLGHTVKIYRNNLPAQQIYEQIMASADNPVLVLSPGPGTPGDFDVAGTLEALVRRRLPAFGVCLGLQGMVEYFGGTLGVLHGTRSMILQDEFGRLVAPVR